MARHRIALLGVCLIALHASTHAYKFLEPQRDRFGRALLESGEPVGPAVHAAGDGAQHADDATSAGEQLTAAGSTRSMLSVDAAAQGQVPLVHGGLVRDPEARILYREIEVFADGAATVTSTSSLQTQLPGNVTSFSYTANLQCSYGGSISPTVGTCAFMGKPVRAVVDPQVSVTPTAAEAMIDGQCNLNSNAGTYCDYKLKGGATIFMRGMGVVKYAPAATAAAPPTIQAIQAERLYVRSIQYNTGPEAFIGTLFSLTNTVVGFKRGVVNLNAARDNGSFLGVVTFELSM